MSTAALAFVAIGTTLIDFSKGSELLTSIDPFHDWSYENDIGIKALTDRVFRGFKG